MRKHCIIKILLPNTLINNLLNQLIHLFIPHIKINTFQQMIFVVVY